MRFNPALLAALVAAVNAAPFAHTTTGHSSIQPAHGNNKRTNSYPPALKFEGDTDGGEVMIKRTNVSYLTRQFSSLREH